MAVVVDSASGALVVDDSPSVTLVVADLEDVLVGDVTEEPGVGLPQALGAPAEVCRPQEVAVLGEVVRGVRVPPAPTDRPGGGVGHLAESG